MTGARFYKPGLKNKNAEQIIEGHSDRAVNQINKSSEQGKGQIKDTAREVISTPGQALNPQEDQSTNIAKTGGTKGSLTGKNFDSTLRLVRNVDRYNNKPVEHMFHYGSYKGSGIQNLGTGYERPRIETEETREMERNRALDLSQKQLMIQLQDAINRKDVEAFKSAYEQLFGITVSTTSAIQAMRQWTQQQQITNTATKDITSWQKEFLRGFDEETIRYLVELTESGDEQLSTLLTNAMYGLPTPSLDERLLQDTMNNLAGKYMEGGMSPLQARLHADNVIDNMLQHNNNQQASSIKNAQNIPSRFNDWRKSKSIVKDAKEL